MAKPHSRDRPWPRPTSPARALLGVCLATACLATLGCGGSGQDPATTHTGAATSASGATPKPDGDHDVNSLGQGPYDTDNDANPTYGPPASANELQAMTELLHRYYAAAAAGDGRRACAILDPLVGEALLEEHHPGKGPRALRGPSCAQIAAKAFALHHRELVEDAATLKVGWAQTKAARAYVLVHFTPTRELLVFLHRSKGIWQMDTLLDSGPL